VLEPALVECVAQTAAAALGQRAQMRGQSGSAGIGMLTAVSDFQIHSRAPAGKQLQIKVRELRRLGPMLLVAGTVSCEGREIASGELMLYA
jgi:3-hydroxymyristoyl/3-hydroxydecanoyl-(acyl carrier protein) dehydratase